MLKFLFWNINQQPLTNTIARLALKHEVDVLILAECKIPAGSMLATLNQQEPLYSLPNPESLCEKIVIYTRFYREFIVAPAMGGYKYRLLVARHNVDIYPLTLFFEPTNTKTEASNQEDFEKQLGSIFSSDKTQNIVKSLIAQSQQ